VRFKTELSNDKHCVFPCRRTARTSPTSSRFIDDTLLSKAIEEYWRVEKFRCTVVWTVSGGLYTRVLDVTRTPAAADPAATLERRLMFPGVKADYAVPTTAISADPAHGHDNFRWAGQVIQGVDAVFNSTTLAIELLLFNDGYQIPSDGVGIPTGSIRPSCRVRLVMDYDDGSEGQLTLHTSPAGWEIDGGTTEPPITLPTTGTIYGVDIGDMIAGDSVAGPGLYFDGGVPPTITIEPQAWFEYRKSNTNPPIWNATTGAEITTPYTNEE
jgi:hypothetical protein